MRMKDGEIEMAIYDCFTYFNEIEILKYRLKLLYDMVDKFVIVEMNMTFRGAYKDFNLEKRWDELKEYQNKIIYIKEDNPPSYDSSIKVVAADGQIEGDWSLEKYQRNCLMKGLVDCRPDDLVIISDVDEIPNPDILKNIDKVNVVLWGHDRNDYKGEIKNISHLFSINPRCLMHREMTLLNCLEIAPVSLKQEMYYYYMNCKSDGNWYGSVMSKYKNMYMPQVLRDWRNYLPLIKKGGWHFSYLGGVERIKKKLISITDGNPELANDEKYIEKCIFEGKDLFNRKGDKFYSLKFIGDDELTFPLVVYLKKHHPNFFARV